MEIDQQITEFIFRIRGPSGKSELIKISSTSTFGDLYLYVSSVLKLSIGSFDILAVQYFLK
jgi:hypothetical protein